MSVYDEWANQDFSSTQSLAEVEMANAKWADGGAVRMPSSHDDGVVIDFPMVSSEPPMVLWDDFLIGDKGDVLTPLRNEELPDGGTLDDIIVTGVRRPTERPEIPEMLEVDPDNGGGGGGGGDIDQRPHSYFDQSRVGDTSCDVDEAWQGLRDNAAPGQENTASTGMVVNVPGFGPVVQTVNWSTLTVTNTTMEGHLLHPGIVSRQLISIGGEIFVETTGVGTGSFATANEFFSSSMWSFMDALIAAYVDANDDGEGDC